MITDGIHFINNGNVENIQINNLLSVLTNIFNL